ncbi:MAG: Outer membrane porin F precursor [Candidatus Aminicenantes bacterium ADurb.Bin508]|nr:MAG: Outer membrane porin F precursor [Candidatus Aminicenantes bacterium ADurb.Bin508]
MAEDLARFGRTRVYGINFDTDSAVIRAESKAVLDRIVTLLKADGSLKITVEGHTDNTGSLARNKALSQERADAVKAYLVKGGVDGARLRSVGYGSEKPVGNNGTAAGRAQNRRVELAKS